MLASAEEGMEILFGMLAWSRKMWGYFFDFFDICQLAFRGGYCGTAVSIR